MAHIEERVMNIGILAALVGGVYLVYKMFSGGGTWKWPTLPTWPTICDPFSSAWCVLGGGSVTDACVCIPAVDDPTDAHGCHANYQHWCSTDGKCFDNAQACTPAGGCPDCEEWSPMYSQCLFSPSKCVDDHICSDGTSRHSYQPCPECSPTKACSDGSYVCPTDVCPPYIPDPVEHSCTCGSVVYDHISDVEIGRYGSCGSWCDALHPTPVDEPCPCDNGYFSTYNPPIGWHMCCHKAEPGLEHYWCIKPDNYSC